MSKEPPLIVITGPTASGKTGLALELAEGWGGEIICADSRTVYKEMDIGTAKPTQAEQKRVPHWLLDVARPDQRYTAADFQKAAYSAIADIRKRGKIPFLVGGSGLYIDSVVQGFSFAGAADQERRVELEKKTIDELKEMLKRQHRSLPENQNNKRYLVRALEKQHAAQSVNNPIADSTVVIAIATDRAVLEERIRLRADEIFEGKIVQETQHLLQRYGKNNEAMTGNIYPIVGRMIDGELSPSEAKELFVIRDRQLAKKQITWLKRHDYVKWYSLAEAREYLNDLLRKCCVTHEQFSDTIEAAKGL